MFGTQRRRMTDKAEMVKVNKIMFGKGMKCCRPSCGAPVSVAEARATREDHHYVLCESCVKLGISLGKLTDPMENNPLKDW